MGDAATFLFRHGFNFVHRLAVVGRTRVRHHANQQACFEVRCVERARNAKKCFVVVWFDTRAMTVAVNFNERR